MNLREKINSDLDDMKMRISCVFIITVLLCVFIMQSRTNQICEAGVYLKNICKCEYAEILWRYR